MIARRRLSGPERAAAVVAQLDDDCARRLLHALPDEDAAQLLLEVARLRPLGAREADHALAAVVEETLATAPLQRGGIDVARRLLRECLGDARAARLDHVFDQVVRSLEEDGAAAPDVQSPGRCNDDRLGHRTGCVPGSTGVFAGVETDEPRVELGAEIELRDRLEGLQLWGSGRAVPDESATALCPRTASLPTPPAERRHRLKRPV